MLVTRIFHLATEKKLLGTWIKKLVLDPDKNKDHCMPCALSDSSILALFASNAKSRAVTKVSSCQVYTVYSGSAMCCIFLLVPLKVARGHVHSSWGKSLVLGR